jgi:hypothetical protein
VKWRVVLQPVGAEDGDRVVDDRVDRGKTVGDAAR